MLVPKPGHCRTVAYELFASQLAIIESSEALCTAAVAIAMHEMVDADAHAVDMKLQAIADRARDRMGDRHASELFACVHTVLFDDEEFRGNTEDYYNPVNSYLPAVLDTKRGIPITLTLIYKSVVERLGLRVDGIHAPYHFLAGVTRPGHEEPIYVDPFGGGAVLSRDQVFDLLDHVSESRVPRSIQLLPRATNRQWLSRILQNLQAIFTQKGRQSDLSAMLELRTLLERS